MKYIVEVRYTGVDWADLMADMRSWLDRRQIKVEEFSQTCSVVASPCVSAFATRIRRRHLRLRFQVGWNPPSRRERQCRKRCAARRKATLIPGSQKVWCLWVIR